MRASRNPFALLAAGLLGTATACAFVSGDSAAERGEGTTLVVHNNNSSDMDVYVAPADGPRVLLGFAPGEGTTRFTLPPTVVGARTVRLSADPVGGSGAARSDALAVRAGDRVTVTIAANLALSVATVR
jgi:hypothetical protein